MVLVYKSPLFPEVEWDPCDFDAPIKVPSLKALAGYFEIDFDKLPAAHKKRPSTHPLNPKLNMPQKVKAYWEENKKCVQCKCEMFPGTAECWVCYTEQPQEDYLFSSLVSDTRVSAGDTGGSASSNFNPAAPTPSNTLVSAPPGPDDKQPIR